MNRITDLIPVQLVRGAIAALSLTVLVATVTATVLSPSTASATTIAPAAERQALCAGAQLSRSAAGEAVATSKRQKAKTKAKAKAPAKKKTAKALRGVLNINRASAAQLQMLPGVGPAKAERVVAYRKRHGNFARVKDLRRVKGFGYKSLKKLDKWLTVKGPSTLELVAANQ